MGISGITNRTNNEYGNEVAKTLSENVTSPGPTGVTGDMKKDPAANPNISLNDVANTRIPPDKQHVLNNAVNRHRDVSVKLDPKENELNRRAEHVDETGQMTSQYGDGTNNEITNR